MVGAILAITLYIVFGGIYLAAGITVLLSKRSKTSNAAHSASLNPCCW